MKCFDIFQNTVLMFVVGTWVVLVKFASHVLLANFVHSSVLTEV